MTNELIGVPVNELEVGYPAYTRSQIAELMQNPDAAVARERMLQNVSEVQKTLDEILESDIEQGDAVATVTNVVMEAWRKANPEADVKVAEGLSAHLNEVQDSVRELVDVVDDEFLTPREKELLVEVVAPLHDLFKLLGGKEAQIMADHELIAAYLLKKYLPKMGYTTEDVGFVTGVIGNHENIYKEEGRRGYMSSEDHIERARGVFFLADTLTGVVELEGKEMKVDSFALEKRFGDLYFRHIDLVTGKVFRPEWGVAAVGDYAEFLKVLSKQGGLTGEIEVVNKIIESAERAIERANNGNDFSEEQQKVVDEASEGLKKLKFSIEK